MVVVTAAFSERVRYLSVTRAEERKQTDTVWSIRSHAVSVFRKCDTSHSAGTTQAPSPPQNVKSQNDLLVFRGKQLRKTQGRRKHNHNMPLRGQEINSPWSRDALVPVKKETNGAAVQVQ